MPVYWFVMSSTIVLAVLYTLLALLTIHADIRALSSSPTFAELMITPMGESLLRESLMRKSWPLVTFAIIVYLLFEIFGLMYWVGPADTLKSLAALNSYDSDGIHVLMLPLHAYARFFIYTLCVYWPAIENLRPPSPRRNLALLAFLSIIEIGIWIPALEIETMRVIWVQTLGLALVGLYFYFFCFRPIRNSPTPS